jgi:hypothetical protein
MSMKPSSYVLPVLALTTLLACGQPSGDPAPTSTATDTGQATADESGTTVDAATSTTATPGTSDDGSTTATTPEDPCLALSYEDCLVEPGCAPMATYTEREGTCDLDIASRLDLCVSVGEPLAAAPTSFYAEIDGELRYAAASHPCTFDPVGRPVGWTECSGAATDPAPCQCLCGSQGCPTQAELLVLQACGLPVPCGEVAPNDTDMASTYDLCVLAALRDRTPGEYGSARIDVTPDLSRVFLDGGEQARLLHQAVDDFCDSALLDPWEPTRTCTLQPPAWFDACITDPTLQPDCLLGESWFQDCEEQPPRCP